VVVTYRAIAVFSVRRSAIRWLSRDFLSVSAGFKTSTRVTDRIARMAMTIKSSSNVNPRPRELRTRFTPWFEVRCSGITIV
jgi:hypothetical protein